MVLRWGSYPPDPENRTAAPREDVALPPHIPLLLLWRRGAPRLAAKAQLTLLRWGAVHLRFFFLTEVSGYGHDIVQPEVSRL